MHTDSTETVPNIPQLTPAGRQYAETHPDSMVARVALAGLGVWPDSHVAAAVEACNRAATHPRDR